MLNAVFHPTLHRTLHPTGTRCLIVAALLALTFSTTALAVTSTFDSGLDGWTCTLDCSWSASGGNLGGYLRHVDTAGPRSFAFAPSKFLGDWSALDGDGSILFDHTLIFVGPQNDGFNPYEVVLSGPSGAAT